MVEFNKCQTQITEEELNILPQEVREQFLDAITNIPFVKRLISKDRPYAKDLKRDSDGKIIIDITQPHIIEDTDYFRPSAIHYNKYGCFTKLKPNANPNSEYGKWIREEIRRCWEGYIRPSDGEWITGDMYFFLNYCPIQLTKKNDKGLIIRTLGFPEFYDGNYYRFHYLNQCRNEGRHAMELAKRGAGKSLSAACMLAKRFILGESNEVKKKVQCVATASERKYIQGANQLLDMFQYYIDFCADNTEFPSQRLTSSLQNMQWTMGYLDVDSGTRKGTQNSVMGITSKDDESKLRGSRGVLYLLEEAGCHIKGTECIKADKTIEKVENIKEGDFLLGPDMNPRKVLKVFTGNRDLYKITLSNGDTQIVTDNHPVYVKVRTWGKNTKEKFKTFTCKELLNKNYKKGYYICKQPVVYNYKEVFIDPYMLGLWLGDGDSSRISFSAAEEEIREYFNTFGEKCYLRDLFNTNKCKVAHFPKKENKTLYDAFNRYNLFNNKHIPEEYKYNSKEIGLNLLAGVIDSDGYYDSRKCIYEITQHSSRKHIIYDLKEIAENLGMKCSIATKISRKKCKKPGELYYRLFISSNVEIPVKIQKKKFTKRSHYRNKINWLEYSFNIEYYGKGEYYGFLLDKDHLFLLKDKTIVHNSFPRLLNLYQVLRPSVEDGNRVFGLIYGYGTSGDKDSDFSSMQELMYNPDGYNIKGVPNVYDKEGQGRRKFSYFYPGYLNRADCYDENGNSDVVKAILEILNDRYTVKYNSTDINAITKRIAEIPLTPQEAIQRSRGNIFPITELTQRLNEIDNNPNFYDDVYVGTLVMNSNGNVEFSILAEDKPIRDFPTKDNKVTGALEIYEMPQKVNNKVPSERYIISLDNYENDESNTMSLGSLFILDLWTDRIVAEYTGRPMYVDDLNELARKVCLFYNAKILYEAHPYSQMVRTPYGTKTWGDISIGDTLFAPNGKTVKVVDIPVDTEMPIYKVTLEDGREIMASDNHIWSVYKLNNPKIPILLTTKEMMNKGTINKHNQHNFFIPNGGLVEYDKKNVPIDPYTLGLLIAEGCFVPQHCHSTVTQLSSNEEDMSFYKKVIPYNVTRKDSSYNWNIHIERGKEVLNKLGLYGHKSYTKHIPSLYLFNDVKTRMELLKGLMDGDGCSNSKGAKIFITASRYLANDVMSLCRSLGINSKVKYNELNKNGKIYKHYRVSIYTNKIIFKLPRKIQNCHVYKPDSKGSKANAYINKTAIKSIEYSHIEKGKCVTVNSKDGLYMIGDYVVTHNCNKKNTFSYFSRMNSLHLLADTPEYLKNKQLIKSIGYGNTSKGVNATLPIKNFGFTLIRDWLLKPVTITKEENGGVIEYTVPNLHFIKNRALIKELILYNPAINVDRIMSLVQLMLYREEKMILYQGDLTKANKVEDRSYLGNDPFFERNYKPVNLAKDHINY